MKRVFELFTVIAIYVFCLVVLLEIGVNYFAFRYMFPIKNATSYGYMTKKSAKIIIPLNKYSTRFASQLSLPFELAKAYCQDKIELNKIKDESTGKIGFKDSNDKIIINYQFDVASEFYDDNYAIAGIKIENKVKYGTIDKSGNWIIEPKFELLCPFNKYHTKACLDSSRCGVVDRFGAEVTMMSFNVERLKCDDNCGEEFCSIGKKDKETACNYFL